MGKAESKRRINDKPFDIEEPVAAMWLVIESSMEFRSASRSQRRQMIPQKVTTSFLLLSKSNKQLPFERRISGFA